MNTKISDLTSTLKAMVKKEFKVFASAFAIIFCALIFIQIADEVFEGATKNFDKWAMNIFREENNPAEPIGAEWVTNSVRDITALGSGTVIVIFTIAVLGFLLFQKEYIMAYLILGATIGGGLLGLFLKEFFGRERPDLIYHLMPETSLSFPSGHSMMSMVIYLSFAALLARIQNKRSVKIYIISIALFLSFIIGVSRIYLGVHYATDVMAGWSIGLAWAALCWLFAYYLQHRKNKKLTSQNDSALDE